MRNPFRPIRDDDDRPPPSDIADKLTILFAAMITLIGVMLLVFLPDVSRLIDSIPQKVAAPPPERQHNPGEGEILVPIYGPEEEKTSGPWTRLSGPPRLE